MAPPPRGLILGATAALAAGLVLARLVMPTLPASIGLGVPPPPPPPLRPVADPPAAPFRHLCLLRGVALLESPGPFNCQHSTFACIRALSRLDAPCSGPCRRLSPTSKLNRMLNNNLRLFGPEQRAQLQTLAGGRHKHLLRHWPAPGRRDEAKRALVAKAAAGAASGELEAARLGAPLTRPCGLTDRLACCMPCRGVEQARLARSAPQTVLAATPRSIL